MMPKPDAFILGASGLVGRELVDVLLEEEAYGQIGALLRRPLDICHPRFDQLMLDSALVDRIPGELSGAILFISFGTTIAKAGSREAFKAIDLGIPLRIARQARAAGVTTCVLVSAVGADARSRVFYSRIKGRLEEALAALGFERLLIFRPSLLLGDRREERRGEQLAAILARGLARIHPGLLGPYSGMPAQDLARAMARAALTAAPGRHIYYFKQTMQLLDK